MKAVKKEEQLMQTSSSRTAIFSQHGSRGGNKPNKGNDKFYNHYKKKFHNDAECIDLHPHLKATLDERLKKKRSGREKKRENQKSKSNDVPDRKISMLAIRGCASRNATFDPAFELDD